MCLHPVLYTHVPPFCVFFLFFFSRYGAHRDLHSFPTRRSSDLEAVHGKRPFASLNALHEAMTAAIRDASAEQRIALLKGQDRKSTRLNSSHLGISYAVFCLKKKKKQKLTTHINR